MGYQVSQTTQATSHLQKLRNRTGTIYGLDQRLAGIWTVKQEVSAESSVCKFLARL